MRLTRYLKPPQIKLELDTRTPAEIPEDWTQKRFVWSIKEPVLQEIAQLFASTGKVGNETKPSPSLATMQYLIRLPPSFAPPRP